VFIQVDYQYGKKEIKQDEKHFSHRAGELVNKDKDKNLITSE